MKTIAQDLGGVVRLLEKATAGVWNVECKSGDYSIVSDDDTYSIAYPNYPRGEEVEANMQAIVAAVNFLRAHSAEIAGSLRDAERYRWLKCNCQHMPDELGIAGQLYFGTYAWGDLDTAIDSAMQQGGGGGE